MDHVRRRLPAILLLLLPAIGALALSCGGGGGGGGKEEESEEKGFRVLETSPRDNELAVGLDAEIEIEFSEEIDPATLTGETVRILEAFTRRDLYGTLDLDVDRKTARFVPAGRLSLNTLYRIEASTTITNRGGEPLRKDFEAHFRTAVFWEEEWVEEEEEEEGRLLVVGSLSVGRSSHTSTRLPSGKVLVTGGFIDATTVTDSAEVYDPLTRSFDELTETLWIARANHRAILLESGLVLITGGVIDGGTGVTDRCELFDPVQGTFAVAPALTQPRAYHTATRLGDGRVLVTGGADLNASGNLVSTRTAEIYDPGTNTWSAAPSMAGYRSDHQATALLDGRILITGGSSWNVTAELFDPSTDSFTTTTGAMQSARSGHSATPLVFGDVLLYGGGSGTASRYRAATGTFESVVDTPLYDRLAHTADITAGGRVTIAGGMTWFGSSLTFHSSLEFFNGPPSPNAVFEPSTELFLTPRAGHRSTVLKNGDILYSGGINTDPSGDELSDAALYTFD